MKISDEISLSARNLLRRKGRTALTLVGVVIGCLPSARNRFPPT